MPVSYAPTSKFNHHANFQRRREACSRKKLKNLHFYTNAPASKAPTKKFNHRANFQRRREACSRNKLKNLHFYTNAPASKAPTKNLTITPIFNVGVKLAHAKN